MIQGGLPIPQPDSVSVPLPQTLERWRDLYLHDAGQKLLAFVVIVVLLYALTRLVRRVIRDNIEDVNRRHILQKYSRYTAATLLVLSAVALFADSLAGLGTILAVLLAGVAVALQDVLKSIVGWLYVSGRSGIEVGSRIQVGAVEGDVVDIGVLKTTVLEVGQLVYGRQSTGRLVTVPNYRLLSENVHFQGTTNPWAWQEVRVTITFESDWKRAEELLREIGEEMHAEIGEQLEEGFRRLEQRYAFKYGTLTPIVYLTVSGTGVELTLRFLTPVRRHRGSIDRVSRRILTAFAAERSVELAHPTYRVYRRGEAGGGQQDESRGLQLPREHESGEEGLPPPDMLAGEPDAPGPEER
jgi:small-conductance mechanosensitive channel